MNKILDIIKDPILTYEQKVLTLARAAEDSIDVLNISKEVQDLRDKDIICDLYEGHAPYRPRYIVPDYEKFLKQGSKFLKLEPTTSLEDAINNLIILYRHVPSISSFPVYIGNLDVLLNPFVKDDEKSFQAIKRFLKYIDRTITDSFCHANIGPLDTIAGRLILRAERELQDSIPNITIKYSKETSDDFAIDAINTALITAKPSFANDQMFRNDFKGDYAIVSCYNGLNIGGGSYSLVRLKMNKLAFTANDLDDFLESKLPTAANLMLEYLDERVRFLVEETPFFERNFLVKEGLIDINNFTAMFGMVGLAEAVNCFIENPKDKLQRFGHSVNADNIGIKIMDKLYEIVQEHKSKYLYGSNGHYLLHAQVGIDTDNSTSPGCRIPIGEEPEIHEHVLKAGIFHKYFPSGIGDIFSFDSTVKNNPNYVLDIIKGSFKNGMRYFSPYASDCDVIRITGYLVKISEIEKLREGEQVLRDTVALGMGSVINQHILDRKIRK
ncbi:YjjI family glycine radical enzyme [Helicovermis profundi]|uniref:YjjI family glycine radical enzyme n=1 Tax=Helicovermis profundi TaxID=3065157 RepID=A0AAU9ECP4_9FIRM|nr:YjjI family glycine radical enzyme [Clostridia bacterium S502]